jgi:hypothetical protein
MPAMKTNSSKVYVNSDLNRQTAAKVCTVFGAYNFLRKTDSSEFLAMLELRKKKDTPLLTTTKQVKIRL